MRSTRPSRNATAPSWSGRPVIVGGSPDKRGVVSAANYVARRDGVHSAMPSATARRLCPRAVFLPPRISRYAEVSRRVMEIFERFTPLVEPLSLDEAFLDVTGSTHLFGSAVDIGRRIKRLIREELGLVVSVGVAPNKFLAKIASDLEKPDGFVVVEPERIHEFLDPLPIARIWGVGRQGGKVFERLGIRTIGQLRRWPLETLKERFGSNGEHFWHLARGLDDRPVIPEREAKSISNETTFERDIADAEILRAWLMDLTEQVAWRLRGQELQCRTVQLKVRFADFTTITRSQTLPEPTDITQELWRTADDLFRNRLPAEHPAVRLLGMGVGNLEEKGPAQELLFEKDDREKQSGLDAVTDQIREQFGRGALRRGTSLGHGEG